MIDTKYTIRSVGALVELNSALASSFRRLAAGPKPEAPPTSTYSSATPKAATLDNAHVADTINDASAAEESTAFAAQMILSSPASALSIHGRFSREFGALA